MRRRFFVNRFDANSIALTGDAAEHLGRVLRAEPGQQYELSDGQRVFLARIERITLRKRGESSIEFTLVEPIDAREPALKVELLMSLIKFDRFEWCLEKATELGVTEIVPLAAARTDKPLIAAAGKRIERWQKIVLESAQQSRRLRPPEIRSAVRAVDAFALSKAARKILLSERRDAKPMAEFLRNMPQPTASLAIGPEGGWTDDELAAARTAGFVEASLGENILRTETAVIASLALLQFASLPR
ncbi:MAG: RsmE family RNA methyltransferase [Candidatus Acidiferrales bacterium]